MRTHDAIIPQGCSVKQEKTAKNTKVEEGGNFLSFINDTAKETQYTLLIRTLFESVRSVYIQSIIATYMMLY